MKKVSRKILLALGAGVLVSLSVFVWSKLQSFVKSGIADSQKIRLSEADVCQSDQAGEANFSGCNSIL